MVIPRNRIETIIRSVITNENDYLSIVEHLQTYRKHSAEWDVYRKKIADDLLKKLKNLLTAARESGFINPVVRDGKIVFDQILSINRNADQCTVCDKNIIHGNCNGIMRIIKHKKTFFPCWR